MEIKDSDIIWRVVFSSPPKINAHYLPWLIKEGLELHTGYWCGSTYMYFQSYQEAARAFNRELDDCIYTQTAELNKLRIKLEENEQQLKESVEGGRIGVDS